MLQKVGKNLRLRWIFQYEAPEMEKDPRFGTWNILNLCRADAMKFEPSKTISKICNLDLVGVHEVKWNKEPADSLIYTHTNVHKI
jgi:hypothetical protein